MTDRELLVFAAKAAGVNGFLVDAGLNIGSNAFPKVWNPLTDDGDALRLAVSLGMTVDCDNWCAKSTHQEVYEWSDGGCDGPYAATRRAIVIAAAEIGKATP